MKYRVNTAVIISYLMYSLNIPHSDQNPDFSDISLQRNDIAIGKEF